MRSTFKLFNSHLDLSHHYWSQIVPKDGFVIDATCGNGHDTLFLAKICFGKIIAYDIQESAIQSTKKLLEKNDIDLSKIEFMHTSHEKFENIQDNSVDLIVYNLGYLPGSDKSVKTQPDTTLRSIKKALNLIKSSGAISITFYPGHPEGLEEQKNILAWASHIDPQVWSCCHHQWLNRRESPTLFLMQKAKS
jgi:tRNA G37 N-methylase Trm5